MLTAAAGAQATVANLIHHWPANGNADDAAGSADGVLHNPVVFGDGQFGQSFHLSGGFVTFGTQAGNFGTSDFTISFWMRTTSRAHTALLTKRAICNFTAMID